MKTRTIVIALAGMFIATSLWAQQPWDGPAFSAAPQAVAKAAGALGTDSDKEVGATTLLYDSKYVFDAQGRLTATRRMVYRVDAAAALENDWANISVRWEPWHQKPPRLRARTITPDGVEHALDPKTLSDAPAYQYEENIFSETRATRGPLPAVSVGSVVEQESVLEDKEPFFDGGITRRVSFESGEPILRQRLVVEAPSSLPLRYTAKLLPNVQVHKEETGGIVRLTFEQPAMPGKENWESLLPGSEPRAAYVEISTGASWQQVAQRYQKIIEPRLRPEEVKALVGNAAPGASRDEIIRRLVARLHQEVRYTGVEFGEAMIVPQPPAEVLKRKYGDCKDKGALLVSMLRAAGIEAHLALLNADDEEQDVDPEMPGLGHFDHVIVYVPGATPLWIDATAESTPAGELPWQDQGRMALIVADNTTQLTRTPESTADTNVAVEQRQVFLSEFGGARVVENTELRGSLADSYRRDYTAKGFTKEEREALENYAQNTYLSDTLGKIEHSDSYDVSRPFTLHLEMEKAKRGTTELNDAAVAIPAGGIVSQLPEYFRTEPEKETEGKPAKKPARTQDFVIFSAFTWEWHYRIVPPPSFRPVSLPPNRTIDMTAAQLTQEYKAGDDGVVYADWKFVVPRRRFTAAEGKALRQAIADLYGSSVAMVSFEHQGYTLLKEGKIRAGLKAYEALAEKHPREAVHRVQIAGALLSAGLGEAARTEARTAVELDPKSALAWRGLGDALMSDLLGREFSRGFDRDGAVAAYRKSVELDPQDWIARTNLATTLEHNPAGERYGQGAKLDEAIAVLGEARKLEGKVRDLDERLILDLMYSGKYKDALAELEKLPHSAQHATMSLIALAASQGAKAAIAQSRQLASGDGEQSNSLIEAGRKLMTLRLYPQAAELMAAGANGQQNSAQVMPLIGMLQKMHRYEEVKLDPADPKTPMLETFIQMIQGKKMAELRSTTFLGPEEEEDWKDSIERAGQQDLVGIAQKAGLPGPVLLDLLLPQMKFSAEGEDAVGYRLIMQSVGAAPQTIYGVKKDGRALMLTADEHNLAAVGRQALAQLAAGNVAGARRWLDWAREELTLAGGEDLLSGHAFPRLWTRGQPAEAPAIRLAAIALMVQSRTIARYLPEVQQARDRATSDAERTTLDLVLADGYATLENWAELEKVGARLYAASPNSARALALLSMAYTGLRKWPEWEQALADRTKRLPDDYATIRTRARWFEAQGQYDKAREVLKQLMDSGKAQPGDLNEYAWDALFTGKVTDEDIAIAQDGVAKQKNYAVLHTLACLYAEVGKTKEARQVLLQAMEAGNRVEPDGSTWYGFGRIAEQYGRDDAARNAYARVEKPTRGFAIGSTYSLAQQRVKGMAPAAAAGK